MEKEAEKYWMSKSISETNHCFHFKWYYIGMVVAILVGIIAIAASPEELKHGDRGCGECTDPSILC